VKSINHIELSSLVDHLSELKGSEIQKVTGSLKKIHLHFWNKGPQILVFCPLAQKPYLVYSKNKQDFDALIKKRMEDKPLFIFLKSHIFGQFVSEVKVNSINKRVFEIHFENGAHLEFRVFSGGGNLGAFNQKKKVYLRKPQELIEDSGEGYKPEYLRTPQVLFDEGLEELLSMDTSKKKESQKEDKALKARKKIEKAIEDIEAGEFLKLAKTLEEGTELNDNLKKLYKENLSKRENIERAYSQIKVSEQKKQRLFLRLKELDKDLSLKNKKASNQSSNVKKTSKSIGVLFKLSDKITLRCGRNAKENLELLRQSKSWHIWMHMSDYPSGHLIIDLPKNYKLKASELEKCAYFLFLRGAPKKLLNSPTQKFEIMFTECRYVRAQKKNKGLVTTQSHKSLTFTWKSEYVHMF